MVTKTNPKYAFPRKASRIVGLLEAGTPESKEKARIEYLKLLLALNAALVAIEEEIGDVLPLLMSGEFRPQSFDVGQDFARYQSLSRQMGFYMDTLGPAVGVYELPQE